MGTNGGALTMEKVVDLETEILQDNALVGNAMAYVTNAKVVAGLKKLRAGGSTTTAFTAPSTHGSRRQQASLSSYSAPSASSTLVGSPLSLT